MEGARLRWRTTTTTLLGFLSLALLIPGTSGLQCHSYTSIQTVAGDKTSSEFSVSSNVSTCSTSQPACVEAHLQLWTEKMAMLVTHRGCTNESLKDRAGYTTSGHPHFTIHSNVSYCQSDLCNAALTDPNAFQVPGEDKASETSSSNQCYSGFVVGSDQDILERVTCRRDYSQCYHGNGTVTAGNISVDFLIKSCQQPTCDVPEQQTFGPVELRLRGACCHSDFCNGKADTVIHSTDFSKYGIENDTQNTFSVAEEVTVVPANIWDSNMRKTTPQNPLYDYEESAMDNSYPWDTGSNHTLNPRTWNLGSPKLSLPFYLLLVALGMAILGIW